MSADIATTAFLGFFLSYHTPTQLTPTALDSAARRRAHQQQAGDVGRVQLPDARHAGLRARSHSSRLRHHFGHFQADFHPARIHLEK